MKRRWVGIAAVLGWLALTGMGGGGAGPVSDTIPRPKENHRVQVKDRQGVSTDLELFSCGGKTFFPLERGEGTLLVPFRKVRRVALGAEQGSRVPARIEVEGGAVLDGALPRTLLCTGSTEFGNFRIEIRGLSEIRFEGPQG